MKAILISTVIGCVLTIFSVIIYTFYLALANPCENNQQRISTIEQYDMAVCSNCGQKIIIH